MDLTQHRPEERRQQPKRLLLRLLLLVAASSGCCRGMAGDAEVPTGGTRQRVARGTTSLKVREFLLFKFCSDENFENSSRIQSIIPPFLMEILIFSPWDLNHYVIRSIVVLIDLVPCCSCWLWWISNFDSMTFSLKLVSFWNWFTTLWEYFFPNLRYLFSIETLVESTSKET